VSIAGISFRTLPYEQCVDVVSAFRNSQREAQRDLAYFEWRYAGRPNGRAAHVTMGFDETGTAVAAASLIPHEFSVAGVVCLAGMVGDVSVAASMRGRGVAAALLAELLGAALARGLAACFVLPNQELTGSLTRAGFQTVGEIRRAIRLLSVQQRLRTRFGMLGGLAGSLLDVALNASDALSGDATHGKYTVAMPQDFDSSYDSLWDRLPKANTGLALRNRSYLQWRFRNKPGAPYRIFELRRGAELAGYVIHHTEERVALVDDFLAEDAAAAQALGKAFAAAARGAAWGDAIQVRYVEQPDLPSPWRGGRYVMRADVQRVMWATAPGLPAPRHWFVTPADKDV